MDQLKLIFQIDEDAFRGYLERATKKEVSLVITDNSSSMLSMKRKGNAVSIRVHRIFLSAGSEVIDEIAGFIRNSRAKTPRIRDFIRQNSHHLKRRPPRKVNIKTEGSCYDLLEMFHSVNTKYFEGRVSASITWGGKGPRRVAARRTLGSFCGDNNNTIRINPMLDNKRVPRYFLEFIVYHEMLHADIGIRTDDGRRSMHSREFRRREKMFEHYDRAIEWEKKKW
ncbi:MAG: SprT-like domain-containing protein [Nitrospirae bacterium]|nr:SprT-like domain-containing protein [Nitrospirota bacterium]